MIKKIKNAISNPGKVFAKLNSRLRQGLNLDSVLEEVTRRSPAPGRRPRIMLAAPQYDYGDRRRGLSVEENYFHHTLVNAGYDLVAFDTLAAAKKFGAKAMNKMLLESVYREKPDAALFVLSRDEVKKETLLELRNELGVATVNWFCDDHWRFEDFSRFYAPCFTLAVTTDKAAVAKYRAAGVNNVLLSQWACNHYLHRRLDLPYKYDVSFVGQPHGDRVKVIAALRAAGLRVDAFGYGWPGGRISTYEMNRIFCQSRVNLNLSNASVGGVNQIKGRDFEIPGCGGFMLTGENAALRDYFLPGKEIATYTDIPDLIEKARYYLAHDAEREAVKEGGYKRALKDHTYEARLKEVFQALQLK